MKTLFQAFLERLATATDRELARQVQYLKVENAILRSKLPKRVAVTLREKKRLVKYGKPLGAAIKDLIGIVSPRTFARWLQLQPPSTTPACSGGRPRTKAEVCDLVLRLAGETGWGYTRILGELKKLGITDISRSTIRNILKGHGIDTAHQRGVGTWADFIRRHAATLWACDFFSKKVWTQAGMVEVFVLFFLHIGSRRVHIAGLTAHPDSAWMAQQARNIAVFFAEQGIPTKYLIHDCDAKFTQQFDAILDSSGVETIRVGPHAPNLNAYAERWVLSVKSECLDHFVVFGEEHLRYLINEYVRFYYTCRPHQGKDNEVLTAPAAPPPTGPFAEGDIICEERLGGLLKHYRRAG
jgi:putative transposase